MQRKAQRPASQLELEVLGIVFERGPSTADQVREALAAAGKPRNESTVRTLLRRLEAKGYVKHKSGGEANVYTATASPIDAIARAVRNVVDRFCGGSVETLLTGMVSGEVVSPKELERLGAKLRKATPKKR